ncbi:MAG: TetR/AcrR family transcriptional regulator C-terminal domain-containing protein [Bacilli bacterium]|nr:TetR/AcrR family transcriptional regulator C-terminal domain-containing protein [Bacilli bacterium]
MKTEHRLAEALKEMMSKMSLDEISVTALVKKCHVNRQTFYYHFHDIYDLLTLVFLDESIPGIEHSKDIKNMLRCVYDYYKNNKSFIDATINSACRDLFEEFIYNATYKTIAHIVNDQRDSKKLHHNDRKLIARFYSQAYSRNIVYYFSTYKNTTFEGLCNCFAFEDENNFGHAVDNMLKVRGKE